MKSQKGFIFPLILMALAIVLLVAGSIYFFSNKKQTPLPVEYGNNGTTTIATSTVTTTVATSTSNITMTSGGTTHTVVGSGQHCGGNMAAAPMCAEGYQCTPTPGSHLPFGDVGGTCVKNQTGTLTGSVTLSPTCPVERNPPDPQCAPKPYVTEVKVMSADGNAMITSMQSMTDGTFTFTLPAGSYQIVAGGGNPYPRCSSVAAMLQAGSTTIANISCDTGIR